MHEPTLAAVVQLIIPHVQGLPGRDGVPGTPGTPGSRGVPGKNVRLNIHGLSIL